MDQGNNTQEQIQNQSGEVPPVKGVWRRSPDLLRMLKVDEGDLFLPIPAMLKEGLERLWRVRSALKLPQEYTGVLPVELEEVERAKAAREVEIECRMAGLHKPLWQTFSGIDPETEMELSPRQRSDAIRRLMRAIIQLLKFEMAEADKVDDEVRSFMWDPLPKICHYLGISRAKLTRFSKEEMGLSAHEIVDAIRVQKLKERMKESLRETVAFLKVQAGDVPDVAYAVWLRLKASRRAPRWDRQTWAIGLGFPNYARMYRACLVLFGKTPAQMEFEAIEEILKEGRESGSLESGVAEVRATKEEEKVQEVQFFDGERREENGEGVREKEAS